MKSMWLVGSALVFKQCIFVAALHSSFRYTCLGRVVLREFDGTSMPLVFSWALKDYDALVANLGRDSGSKTCARSWDIPFRQ